MTVGEKNMNLIKKIIVIIQNLFFNFIAFTIFTSIIIISPIYKFVNKSKIKKFKKININQSSYWENRP